MTVKIGINGFGRIGRLFLRKTLQKPNDAQVVAINDPNMDSFQMAYFLKFDSVHGRYEGKVRADQNYLYVDNLKIACYREVQPGNIPWSQTGANFILESSGRFTKKNDVMPHITKGGAQYVIITAPSHDVKTFIYGVNESSWKPEDKIFSMGSATSNAVAPMLHLINQKYGIQNAYITAIQSLTAKQRPIDSTIPPTQREKTQEFNFFRLGRGAQMNIIPSSNQVGWPVAKVIPELEGKISGVAFRVPTPDVSALDLTILLQKSAPRQSLEKFLKEQSQGKYKEIIGFTQDEVVSSDYFHTPYSYTYDSKASVFLSDNYVKLIGWFDNEWGYANRLLDFVVYTSGKRE